MVTDKRTDREQSHESPSHKAARENPDGPMTGGQAERLRVLSQEAGEKFDENRTMTAAEAERRIEELQERAGFGDNPPRPDKIP